MNLIKEELHKNYWNSILLTTGVNVCYGNFIETLTSAIDKNAKKKTVLINKKPRENWLTENIKILTRIKRQLYEGTLNNTIKKETYKLFCQQLKKEMDRSKKTTLSNYIINSNNKVRATWEIVKQLTGENNKKNTFNIEDLKKEISETSRDMLTAMNKHFVHTNKPNDNTIKWNQNIKYINETFAMQFTNTVEVVSIIRSLNNTNAVGHDEISTTLLKYCSECLAIPLAILINKSFQSGTFPETLKHTIIKPIYKKGGKSDFLSYRPIALISNISKIIEKVVYRRIMEFINKHKILNNTQNGYINGRSTERAIFQLLEDVMEGINNKERVACMLMDLSKALDSIHHKVLFEKLHIMGFRGTALKWLESYLAQRKQCITATEESGQLICSDWEVLTTEWAQVEVIDLINDGSGLAFGIIGGRSTGVVVKTIVPGGVADRDGRLQSGDHILQIGEVNLRGLGSEQVASVLRQCGVHVRMVVARPIESTSADYHTLVSNAPIVPTKILGDPVELDRHLIENGYGDVFASLPSNAYSTPYIFTGQQADIQLHPIPRLVDARNSTALTSVTAVTPNIAITPTALFPLDVDLLTKSLPETEMYEVQLCKDDLGLGITVAGYVCEKEELSGIFVKSISKGSAADLNGQIKINDRIIEVDGKSVVGHTNHHAVEMLRSTGPKVSISFERYLRGPKYEQLQQAIRANELKPPSPLSPMSTSSLPKIPLNQMQISSTMDLDVKSCTGVDFDSAVLIDEVTPTNDNDTEIVIGGQTLIPFSILSHEAVYEKWKGMLKDDVEIVISEMTKDAQSGLGISLEGTVDVEDGQEVRPHHYIRNILPNGPVGVNSVLQSGDELLEVNGIQLLGMNHVDVVSILKQLPNFVMLVCARYSVPTRIIDTGQCRDAFQARNILAESLQTLIPNNEKLVKAKSDSSIASCVVSEAGCSDLGSRSRSLEMVTGLPMWSDSYLSVELVKSDHGLGFSILDYQDPLNPEQTVIVIRSLVPGGVAQLDGRLIPGDRLIAVNDIHVEHATLDGAVQVLKAAPKGTVQITVAKPISSNDNVSHHSQDTDQEDQTCLDEFQECIEEYQECLEVVQICIEDDTSFNHSSCTSQLEDLKLNDSENDSERIAVNNTSCLNVAVDNAKTASESELELSFNSTYDKSATADDLRAVRAIESNFNAKNHTNMNAFIEVANEKLLQFLRNGEEVSERDGYETCVDESFSDEPCAKFATPRPEINEQRTPTNSNANVFESSVANVRTDDTSSEPCMNMNRLQFTKNIFLDTKQDDSLNSYDRQTDDSLGGDEFFLVQYSKDDLANLRSDVVKCCSEPNVLDNFERPATTRYRRCIEEYYNDYEDCLESYRQYVESECVRDTACEEMGDEHIFSDVLVPYRSRSAPDILDNSFVTLTYDPGPENIVTRRKSAVVCGYEHSLSGDSMTVTRELEKGFREPKETSISNMLQKHWGPIRTVRIERQPNTSLGISIVGGKVDLHTSDASPKTVLGIFVKHVVPDSHAGRTGELTTGDRILEVSGVDLRESSHEKAVEAIRNASNPVTFLIQSIIQLNHDSEEPKENHYSSPCPSPVKIKPPEQFRSDQEIENKQNIKVDCSSDVISNETEPASSNLDTNTNQDGTTNESKPIPEPEPSDAKTNDEVVLLNDVAKEPPKHIIESSEESDEEEDVRELAGRTVSAKGEEIDRASAANVKRTKEEIAADPEEEDDFGYTMNKVKKKYANLGHSILMVQLERGGQGLGLSLAGHKDRNCMAVFVCGINPTGAAYKTGGILVGDEILEVNGVVLHGRCHLNASAIIKSLSGPIFKVIILRRKTAIDDIAVRPITQFPVSLAEEASEEYFSTYPNVRTITVRKGPQGLGIMIIEGKHTDVGQGIFISDLQEGSVAEKAGLEIGEMILAVNKEPLLGSNYDNAATLLKRTEGLVTLIVSNPTKKPTSPEAETAVNDVGPGGSSATTVANSVGGQTLAAGKTALKASAPASRPTTPIPEPPADPSTCQLIPGKDTTLELNSDNKLLGLFFTGGKDTLVPEGIVVVEVYPGGAAEKDGRLQPGDQIIEVNGTTLKDVTYITASQALRQTLPKMKLNVYRPEKIDFQTVEIELVKKPGKGLGLSVIARKSGKGVYVSEILNGGSADVDGKITKGDLLISVNGQSVENATGEEAGAILKTVVGKVALKLHRYKATSR